MIKTQKIKNLSILLFSLIILSSFVYSETCNNGINFINTSFLGSLDIKTGDFNKDGNRDLAAPAYSADLVTMFKNNGAGAFSQHPIEDGLNGMQFVFVIDVDSDGDEDIVGTAQLADSLYWWSNNGDDTFSSTTIQTGLDVIDQVIAGDIDGDNDVDIIVSVTNENKIFFYENDGSEGFTETSDGLTSPEGLQIIDLDNDFDLDFVVVSSGDGYVKWYENDATGDFNDRSVSDVLAAKVVKAIDLDSDGDIDIVAGHYDAGGSTGSLVWFKNNGNEVFTEINISGTAQNIINIDAIDIDNDGDIDIVTSNFREKAIQLWSNNGNEEFSFNNMTDKTDGVLTNPSALYLDDLDNDNINDIIFGDQSVNKIGYISIADCAAVEIGYLSCDFPTLFCDDFNYNNPLMSNTENEWFVYDGGFGLNHIFTPENDRLELNQSMVYVQPTHETKPFEVDYLTTSSLKVINSYYAPLFSIEFDLWLEQQDTPSLLYCMNYETYSPSSDVIFDLYFCPNKSIYYYHTDDQQNDYHINVCENCTNTEVWHKIKINSYFQQDDNTPYNSSVANSYSEIFIDTQLKSGAIPFVNNDSYAMQKYNIIKEHFANFSMDNYYIMVGTDTDVLTTPQYYTSFYDNSTVADDVLGDGSTGDMATALSTIWDDFGLKSTASKVLFGLFLMFVLGVVTFGLGMSQGVHVSALVILVLELLFCILLVYIKLLPIWIPFVLVIFTGGIGAIMFKMSSG